MSRRNMLQTAGLIVATPMLAFAQTEAVNPGATGPAWSPYLVGALIGVLSMFTFYFSDKALGASTAFASVAGLIGRLIAPRHTDSLHYYADKKASKIDWQVALVIGVIIGAFLAAWSGGEITGRWLPPMWTERFGESVWLRLAVAFLGGGLMAFGARMAGGCTSGHGISGAMQLSVGSWIALLGFFAGGTATAMLLFYA
ncbi:MAG: YeeE/YedE thiosulfate transporter family protein [FCB group bacterium]|nr:YeeE/YedE thiosulfate transporter family protein [FCB group bacterium]